MFIDKAHITVKAGNGGNGAVAFRREIYVPAGGPNGGDGGNGGNIVFIVDTNMRTLMDFKYKRKYSAEPGGNGKGSNMTGKNGDDLVIRVPQGTVIRDKESNLVLADLSKPDSAAVIAKGGKGGKGNAFFKNSTRQAPAFAKAGREGEERELVLELKMIADVGLIGFPNVGKSTFLSIVTKANPKIANYHFTTLSPNLGVVDNKYGENYVIADIPGLIEGASDGVGLGHDFLRHIERTKLLVHIVDISGIEGREPLDDFEKINKELRLFNEKLSSRPQIVIANKTDLLSDDTIFDEFKKEVESLGYPVYAMSTATKKGVDEVLLEISKMLEEAEEIDLFSEEEFYAPSAEISNLDDEIKIYEQDGIYYVEGTPIEKLLYSVHFEDMESIRFFQRALENYRVFDRLRQMGINDGDTVKIYELEFDFFD
ncbi:MAG: GTPase ObgE [Peptostreptococcaceae bacterium]|nr:GTPase ObgE [Peptostreptococcaceae bacterium]